LDPEARAIQSNLIGWLLSIAASTATEAMAMSARSGRVFSKADRVAVTAANFKSLIVNRIGIANCFIRLKNKMAHSELKDFNDPG
jgi:hypothetical protein